MRYARGSQNQDLHGRLRAIAARPRRGAALAPGPADGLSDSASQQHAAMVYGTQMPIQILILRPPIIAHACARSEFAYDSEF